MRRGGAIIPPKYQVNLSSYDENNEHHLQDPNEPIEHNLYQ